MDADLVRVVLSAAGTAAGRVVAGWLWARYWRNGGHW
jgi:hypothetical protein